MATVIILKEDVSIAKWIGIIIILIGVALPQLTNLKDDDMLIQNA